MKKLYTFLMIIPLLFFNACDIFNTTKAEVTFSDDFLRRYEVINYRVKKGNISNVFGYKLDAYYITLRVNKKGKEKVVDGIRAIFYDEQGVKFGESDIFDNLIKDGEQVRLVVETAKLAPKFQNLEEIKIKVLRRA
ncbi:MAG: hypothetical protein FWD54_02870 [Endomicrobia bacterium]|nr:hypothetical protein [Endomicrobiia bacterium]MCL2799207.1 hypothetical protein [Endomicrobiia bacterium]